MDVRVNDPTVAAGHSGFHRMYAPDRLTLGFMFPIAQVADVFPDMSDQLAMARRIDALGFGALWVRDVPLHDLDFGDVGQVYDPWVWLGQVAAVTQSITLATGAIVLPLRHPLHVAKAAASVDRLSGARFVLGVASGDRPVEFPAFKVDYETRGERFAAARDRRLRESPPLAGRLPQPAARMQYGARSRHHHQALCRLRPRLRPGHDRAKRVECLRRRGLAARVASLAAARAPQVHGLGPAPLRRRPCVTFAPESRARNVRATRLP